MKANRYIKNSKKKAKQKTNKRYQNLKNNKTNKQTNTVKENTNNTYIDKQAKIK